MSEWFKIPALKSGIFWASDHRLLQVERGYGQCSAIRLQPDTLARTDRYPCEGAQCDDHLPLARRQQCTS